VAGNKLRGRYLARAWRVLDRAGVRQEVSRTWKIRCVTCGRCRRCAALSGIRLDAVD